MIRIAAVLLLALGLTACTDATKDLSGPTTPVGDFSLGYVAVVTEKPEPSKLLVSRDATPEEWIETVDAAMQQRFTRFEGERLYHLGIKVIAYSLPPPVVPGKSALHVAVTVFAAPAQHTTAVAIYTNIRGANLNAPFGATQAVILLISAGLCLGLGHRLNKWAEAR